MSKKFVYLFAEGNENMRDLLGGKGANLAQMSKLGMPVPYGLRSRQKPAISIMRMAKRSMRKSVQRSKRICKLESRPERNSAMSATRCSFRYAAVPERPCRA